MCNQSGLPLAGPATSHRNLVAGRRETMSPIGTIRPHPRLSAIGQQLEIGLVQ